jgi:hypothetical protein
MFTKTQAEEFNLSYGSEVRFLSRMTAKNLNVVFGRTLREMGREVLFGGPSGKDELISAILELHGMGIDKVNEASHVLYHAEDMPNEACKFCLPITYGWTEDTSNHFPSTEDADGF